MTLTLKNLKVHKEGEVKAKLLFRKKRVGALVLRPARELLETGFAAQRVEV